ncbi:hypothetical protein B0H16DRAFT_1466605 [Mycena metata]|uniref:Secreted protein n=1 Tax=Mycena metata TaxID=1033252 RepID=A0AAD7I8I0_9AGAR|nr:hypothetical protein B0H16DRAFT_1466605 [Mycena metata]
MFFLKVLPLALASFNSLFTLSGALPCCAILFCELGQSPGHHHLLSCFGEALPMLSGNAAIIHARIGRGRVAVTTFFSLPPVFSTDSVAQVARGRYGHNDELSRPEQKENLKYCNHILKGA